jgi:hypothetical protein
MFGIVALACTLVCTVAASQNIRETHKATPFGYVHRDCYHVVPSGSHLKRDLQRGDMIVDDEQGRTIRRLPRCVAENAFVSKKRALGNYTNSHFGTYDGWLAYTTFENKPGINTFLGTFSVPDAPAYEPEELFIFTGLQSDDWIPLLSQPPPNFDIIQPVLQSPADSGAAWSARSWFVSLDVGAVASQEIAFDEGDIVFGNMTQTGAQRWFINSVNPRTKKQTYITTSHARLALQPWSYTTVEVMLLFSGCFLVVRLSVSCRRRWLRSATVVMAAAVIYQPSRACSTRSR